MRDWLAEDRQRRLDAWPNGKKRMTPELRAALISAMTTMEGENPWIPGAVFRISPELAPLLIEFCRSRVEEANDG